MLYTNKYYCKYKCNLYIKFIPLAAPFSFSLLLFSEDNIFENGLWGLGCGKVSESYRAAASLAIKETVHGRE
jgi:hypothetical protein